VRILQRIYRQLQMSEENKEAKPEVPQKVRIHIGGISADLASSIQDLQKRLEKYGKIVKPLELHQKPILDYHFAYITMNLTNLQYSKLKQAWDGVRFKGSKLTVAKAKDDYLKVWEKDSKRPDSKILERQKRERTAAARLERIAQRDDNPFKLALVQKGRFRKTPRKTDLKNLTLRVYINGRLRIVKCKKTKLWGVDKNRKIKDLTYRFIAGQWRDGNDHVVDRLSSKVVVFGNEGVKVVDAPAAVIDDKEIEEELLEEHSKANKVLEAMFGKYDFDKPAELDDDDDDDKADSEGKNFDYELERAGIEAEDEDDDETMDLHYNVPEKNCVHPSRQSLLEEYNAHSKVVNFDEDAEENVKPAIVADAEMEDADDDDFYKNIQPETFSEEHDEEFIPSFGASKDQPRKDESEKSDNDSRKESGVEIDEEEEEFIPTFGRAEPAVGEQSNVNTTEKLRALLATSESEANANVEATQDVADVEMELPILKKSRDLGLFFSHFDSPFLVAQAQINKLREIKVEEELEYDDWFWKNRGELNREFRRLRRDALRRTKKKAKSVTLI
jgi:nucleolar protein 8